MIRGLFAIGNPIYLQIYKDIKEAIKQGKYKEGDRIPSEKELAEKWNVSSITPRRALEMLRNEGYIIRQAGRGTFVKKQVATQKKPSRDLPMIGIIFTDFDDSFGIGLLNGIEEAAEGTIDFLFRRSFGDLKKEERIIQDFLRLGVDGFIILPSHATHFNAAILELLVDDVPLVLIDRYLKGLGTTAVSTNNVKSAEKGAKHLFDLGHEHLTVLSPPPSYAVAIEDRIEGIFRAANEENLLRQRDIQVIDQITSTLPNSFTEPNIKKDIQLIKEHLQQNPEVTAIFAIEYNIALLAKEAIHQLGFHCPEDYSIICFDSPRYKPGAFTFTHLIQDQEKMGKVAVQEMLNILKTGNDRKITLLEATLVEGDSTAKREKTKSQ